MARSKTAFNVYQTNGPKKNYILQYQMQFDKDGKYIYIEHRPIRQNFLLIFVGEKNKKET